MWCGFVRSTVVENHELSKIDFDLIDDAFKAQCNPDAVTYFRGCRRDKEKTAISDASRPITIATVVQLI